MKVRELMSKKVTSVSPDASFASVWKIIFKKGIHGLPVVDKDNTLIGIIAEEDLLSKLYPSYQEYMDDFRSASDFEEMEEKIGELKKLQAQDIMNRKIHLTYPEGPILRALSKMIVRQIRQLPVIDKQRKLIGIITKGDVFDYLFKRYLSLPRLPFKGKKEAKSKKIRKKKTVSKKVTKK